MNQLRDSTKPGLISNTHSIPMLNIHLGKLHATKLPDISITSTEDKPFSTFHHHHSEDKSKTITSSSLSQCGTGMPKTEKSAGTLATSPLLMLTILSVNISKELTASSEANAKEETSESNKDGLWLKFKRTEELPFSKTIKLERPNKDSTVTSIH